MTVVFEVYETLIGSLYSQRLRSSDMLLTIAYGALLVLFHNICERPQLPELDIESASSAKFEGFPNVGIVIFSRRQFESQFLSNCRSFRSKTMVLYNGSKCEI